jgi:hypothetical protein
MQELFLLFAKMVPLDQHLDSLQEALTEYKLTGSKEAKDKLGLHSMLVGTSIGTEGKDAFEMVEKMSKQKTLLDAFEHRNA